MGEFSRTVFPTKLMLSKCSWWVNQQRNVEGPNNFPGGFLGLEQYRHIFERTQSGQCPGYMNQANGTALGWRLPLQP